MAPILRAVKSKSPWVKVAFDDGGYNGDEAQRAAFEASRIEVVVVKRTDKEIKGFVVLPKRWIAERTLGSDSPLEGRRFELSVPPTSSRRSEGTGGGFATPPSSKRS